MTRDMEQKLNHFSHEEHPLILSEWRQKKKGDGTTNEEVVVAVCYVCQKQILDSAAYCCFSCNVFLHKRCAELPRQIEHPMHSRHPLVLLENPFYPSRSCRCNACDQMGWKFTYKCSICGFDLDVYCANLDPEIKLDVHDHPLIQVTRPAKFYCNVCYKVAEDYSYLCTVCSFWTHKKCALLPKTAKHKDHNHPLLLAYSLPSDHRSFEKYCSVCDQKVHPSRWVYYCGPCRYFVHVTCIVISQEDGEQQSEDIDCSISGEQDQNVVKLPSSNLAQELIARFLLKKDEISSSNDSTKVNIPEEISVDSHKEGKVQNLDEMKNTSDDHQEEAKGLLVCDRCIEPICSSDDLHYYYACHLTCSNLPPELQIPQHSQHSLSLTYNSSRVGFFRCHACTRLTNGAYYDCKPCNLRICIKCASASMIMSVKHEAHKKHLLTQSHPGEAPPRCAACGRFEGVKFVFDCKDCLFRLCHECALLPPTTTQRWDEHPLLLIYPPYSNHPEEFYCVLCETEIDPDHWMYHCRECDYSLHPRCVPQADKFRWVKFGRSLKVNNHSHPLTHVPEAKYKSFCGKCNTSLDWEEAFECDSCRFYLCKFCAGIYDCDNEL